MIPTLAGISGDEIGFMAVAGGIGFLIIRTIFGHVTKMVRATAAESTRREVAAYVAEGSITSEEAERIINAGRSRSSCSTRA